MFLFIFEDGDLGITDDQPTQEDLESVNDGVLDIVDTETNTFYDHGWVPVEKLTLEAESDNVTFHVL